MAKNRRFRSLQNRNEEFFPQPLQPVCRSELTKIKITQTCPSGRRAEVCATPRRVVQACTMSISVKEQRSGAAWNKWWIPGNVQERAHAKVRETYFHMYKSAAGGTPARLLQSFGRGRTSSPVQGKAIRARNSKQQGACE